MTKPWFLSTPIAHRGLHQGTKIPENSLQAFEEAALAGYPIELDCHFHEESGEILVFHDDDLLRLTGDPRKLQAVSYFEIQKMRLYKTDFAIPRLEDVLACVDGRVPLVIETKQLKSNGRFEQALMKRMENYQGEWALQSFHHGALYYFERHFPHIVKGMLSGSMDDAQISFLKKTAVKSMALLPLIRPQYIAYEAKELLRKGEQLTWRKALGVPLVGWTIRSLAEYRAVRGLCDNVIFENFRPEME